MFEGWDEKVSAFFYRGHCAHGNGRIRQSKDIFFSFRMVLSWLRKLRNVAVLFMVTITLLVAWPVYAASDVSRAHDRPTVALGNCQHLRTNTFKYLLRRIVEEDSSSDCASPARNSYLRAGYVSGCRQKRSVRHVDSFLWFDKYHVASNRRGTRPYCR